MASVKKRGKKKKRPQHTLKSLCHVIQCEMEGEEKPPKETCDTHLKTAIQAQQMIGFDMMMRGFLAKDWMEALIRQGVPSPERKMNALQEIMWTGIIDPLWHERNEIKHGKTGVHDEREVETPNNRIKWYVEHQHEVLSYGDIFLANIDVRTLPTMRTATKQQWLRHLEMTREIYE